MSKFVTFKKDSTNYIYTPDAAENGTDKQKETFSQMEVDKAAMAAENVETAETLVESETDTEENK